MRSVKLIIGFFFVVFMVNAQESEKQALQKLSFLIGDWEGTSTSYGKNGVKKVPVTENVSYLLDGNLIQLNVKSEWIALHTIISYNVKDKKYYYYPFTKNGNKQGYKGEIVEGKFMVYFNESRRLTFTKTEKGEFHEFGERLVNGNWEKYFEDILELHKE
ncbi:hypothetical protein [Tenacibaculum jejuense]|uniref:DUF1579 domain-containing protein n=1 Tax=Tenacibaculum jejuense TaxID=584609 RepID=A0A238UDZ5_9FLAO|nr:hypothetical protein [Tenacibaculum jejuense]SNR16808.1 protein of unknown function [Tenacibaculum jejuense]